MGHHDQKEKARWRKKQNGTVPLKKYLKNKSKKYSQKYPTVENSYCF